MSEPERPPTPAPAPPQQPSAVPPDAPAATKPTHWFFYYLPALLVLLLVSASMGGAMAGNAVWLGLLIGAPVVCTGVGLLVMVGAALGGHTKHPIFVAAAVLTLTGLALFAIAMGICSNMKWH